MIRAAHAVNLGKAPDLQSNQGDFFFLCRRDPERAVNTLVELCKTGRKAGTPYLLIQGNNVEQSSKLAELCRQELDEEPALSYHIGGVISINAGPNLIGLIYWDEGLCDQ